MQERLAWWRSLLISLALTVVIHTTVLLPYTEHILKPIATQSSTPLIVWYLGAALFIATGIHIILYSKLAYRVWVGIYRWLFWHLFKRPPSVFFANQSFIASDIKHYERAMKYCIRNSKVMYCVLALGQTMRNGREQFVVGQLRQLPYDHGKDIRMLFLDPESPFWQLRATQLARKEAQLAFQDVRLDTERLVEQFRQRRAQIAFYAHEPSWRMYIFDDRMFVSRYYEPPHSEMMLVLYRGTQLYNWMYSEFLGLCPGYWRRAEDVATFADQCYLDFQEQQLEARAVYQERRATGASGTQESDWSEAAKRMRRRKKDELLGNLLPNLAGKESSEQSSH